MTKSSMATAAAAGVLFLGAVWLGLTDSGEGPRVHAATCDKTACPEVTCQPGSRESIATDGCCSVCIPDEARAAFNRAECRDVACEPCLEGTRPRETPGQCCPECVSVDEEVCREGQALYAARRAELEEELRGCETDDDCMLASFSDACTASCPLALSKRNLGAVVSRLREEAAVHCDLCYPPELSCPPLRTKQVACAAGRCELAGSGG